MSTDTIAIIKDYLDSPELQVRKNAASALALVGTAEAASELVAVATTDRSTELRAWATQELSTLPKPILTRVVEQLENGFKSSQMRGTSYNTLGLLRSLNGVIRPSHVARGQRILARFLQALPGTGRRLGE